MNLSENDNVIFESAKADFLDAKYHQTIKKIDDLRRQNGDQYDFLLLQARAYAKLADIQTAVELIDDAGTENLRPGDVTFAVKTLLADKQFIPARKVTVVLDHQYAKELITQIETAEFNFKKYHREEVMKLQRRLFYIGSHSADVQAKIVSEANRLPLAEYLEGVKAVLIDRAGWQVIKTQFLFELIGLKIDDQIDLLWLDDKIHQVIPADIDIADSVQPIIETINVVDEKFANDDPIFAQQLSAQIYQLGNYLFPYAEDVIINSDDWIKIIQSYLAGDEFAPNTESGAVMLSWFEIILNQEQRIKYM